MILFSNKPLVVVGTGTIADITGYYLSKERFIAAYAIDGFCIKETTFNGKPIVPIEDIDTYYPPDKYDIFVGIGYLKLNYVRTRMLDIVIKKGYTIASYISDACTICDTLKVDNYINSIGKNVFIFEGNNLQYKSKIGNNVLIWSCNHIGHSTIIRDNVYIASHVVISGNCDIGEYSFIGVNATFADGVRLGRDCLVGAGAYISKSTADSKVFLGNKSITTDFYALSNSAKDMFMPPSIYRSL